MKDLSYFLFIIISLTLILSCKKDDGPEPVRELQEQAPKDDEDHSELPSNSFLQLRRI